MSPRLSYLATRSRLVLHSHSWTHASTPNLFTLRSCYTCLFPNCFEITGVYQLLQKKPAVFFFKRRCFLNLPAGARTTTLLIVAIRRGSSPGVGYHWSAYTASGKAKDQRGGRGHVEPSSNEYRCANCFKTKIKLVGNLLHAFEVYRLLQYSFARRAVTNTICNVIWVCVG